MTRCMRVLDLSRASTKVQAEFKKAFTMANLNWKRGLSSSSKIWKGGVEKRQNGFVPTQQWSHRKSLTCGNKNNWPCITEDLSYGPKDVFDRIDATSKSAGIDMAFGLVRSNHYFQVKPSLISGNLWTCIQSLRLADHKCRGVLFAELRW